jgi:hypothetical protein
MVPCGPVLLRRGSQLSWRCFWQSRWTWVYQCADVGPSRPTPRLTSCHWPSAWRREPCELRWRCQRRRVVGVDQTLVSRRLSVPGDHDIAVEDTGDLEREFGVVGQLRNVPQCPAQIAERGCLRRFSDRLILWRCCPRHRPGARLHLGAAAHYWRTDWLRDGGAGRRRSVARPKASHVRTWRSAGPSGSGGRGVRCPRHVHRSRRSPCPVG